MSSASVQFGLSNEWKAFAETHPVFLEKVDDLFLTINRVFDRTFYPQSPADKVVFSLGRLSVEDFMEILLLCGNGYGIGGLKLLRGLYERAVTAQYIADNPDEANAFLEYHHVQQWKLTNHARQLFDITSVVSQDTIDKTQKSYEEVRLKFQEPLCKKCGTSRTRFSWSSLDLASMAHKGSEGLRKLYLPCYFLPTLHAHTTVAALLARLIEKEDGGIAFDEGPQRDKADEALMGAHNVILFVLDTQNVYFRRELENEIKQRRDDFMAMWSKH